MERSLLFSILEFLALFVMQDSRRTKLEANSKKCVFVGYDPFMKGWKCMDTETHIRDVVFVEVSSYFVPQAAAHHTSRNPREL